MIQERRLLFFLLFEVQLIDLYASVNSSCAHPPPGQLRGICVPCQSRGWGISKSGTARGSGICLPRAFDTHGVSDLKSKRGGFYRKGPAVRRRVDRPL